MQGRKGSQRRIRTESLLLDGIGIDLDNESSCNEHRCSCFSCERQWFECMEVSRQHVAELFDGELQTGADFV